MQPHLSETCTLEPSPFVVSTQEWHTCRRPLVSGCSRTQQLGGHHSWQDSRKKRMAPSRNSGPPIRQ